ncbi:inorganic phosphate transporter [Microdochium trichocladiopsis]|uniref:Inorganic phosphate transporter n=1 Tax=Microdochium trichocladiopsis TaxID=1682393 RepID=A0A9P9BK70_9PEZI|nr:inorganic phosphate transporter [Microdochium trichocladiopsis]KAH7026334.1 inorganic phosphate transporter [Microdochium trichocladiopsis]
MDDGVFEAEKRRNRGFLGFDSAALSARDAQDRRQLRYELDLNSWNLRIWGVAASGFLTDSYNLFSTNVILASITFVYFPDQRWPGLLINLFTLLGSVVGQLLFGFLADFYGRTKLYGIELILVIVSTIGVATSSHGVGDLSFLGLFIWWRFVMGIGIGAEYPLSAVITSEWSSSQSRATMLSSVFLMQPCGQALAQLVGLWVLLGRNSTHKIYDMQCGLNDLYEDECRQVVDGIWRIVIGSGAIPALLAIIFRFFLYDCGLYSLEVKNKPSRALRDTQRVYGSLPSNSIGLSSPTGTNQQRSPMPMPVQFSREDLYNFLIRDGNWLYLLGTSMTWFILDVGFYGFSLDNRGTLADMWATTKAVPITDALSCWESSLPGGNSTVPGWALTGLPAWATDATKPCQTIYDVLLEQAQQYLLTVSIPSIAGSACFVFFANRIPRKQWLTGSFFVLAALFVITGGVYYGVAHTPGAPATIVFVCVCHFAFNFGANTLTFIIPAEIFPTAYRCTCHGISAAAGKIGSLVAVLVVYGINTGYKSDTRQGLVFVLFGSVLLLGALYSWAYLPNIERRVDTGNGHSYLETKTLEELGGGREQARLEGDIITVKDKVRELRRRRRERKNHERSSRDGEEHGHGHGHDDQDITAGPAGDGGQRRFREPQSRTIPLSELPVPESTYDPPGR